MRRRVQRSWSASAWILSAFWFRKLAPISIESQTQAAGKERGSSKKQATKTVGHCPTVTICIGGKEVTCLLDTGSMVTTVTEDFFRKNLQDKCDMMNNSFYCLKAANGIDIPYIGFISSHNSGRRDDHGCRNLRDQNTFGCRHEEKKRKHPRTATHECLTEMQ